MSASSMKRSLEAGSNEAPTPPHKKHQMSSPSLRGLDESTDRPRVLTMVYPGNGKKAAEEARTKHLERTGRRKEPKRPVEPQQSACGSSSDVAERAAARPSAIMGIEHVVALLPIADCRDYLAGASDSDARRLLASLAGMRRRTLDRVCDHFDRLYRPDPRAILAFDDIVRAVEAALEPLVVRSNNHSNKTNRSAANPEAPSSPLSAAAETREESLRALLRAKVFPNISRVHALAVFPASFGTRVNAILALLSLSRFMIKRSLLLRPDERRVYDEGPLGGAILDLVRGLDQMERPVALSMAMAPMGCTAVGGNSGGGGGSGGGGPGGASGGDKQDKTIKGELAAQANVFDKTGVFAGIVEAHRLVKERMTVSVQAMPMMMPLGGDEEDSSQMQSQSQFQMLEEEEDADPGVSVITYLA